MPANAGNSFLGPSDYATNSAQAARAQVNSASGGPSQPVSAAQQGTDNNLTSAFNSYIASQGISPAQFQALKTSTNPADIAQYNKLAEAAQNYSLQTVDAQVSGPSLFNQVIGGLALAGSVGALTAGVGAALAPAIGVAGSALGGTAGTVANGAIAGAAGGAAQAGLTGQNIGKGILTGAVGGGLGAGATSYLGGALNNATGIGSGLSNTVVKGAVGAGTGALSAALSGGNVGNAALLGGAGGLASGAVSSLTGNSQLGGVASSLTKYGLSSFLSNNTAPTSANGSGVANDSSAAVAGALGGVALGNITLGGNGTSALQGNNSGMSTDTSLASTIGSAVPGLLQAGAGVYGSQNAAEAQTTADSNAIGTQQNTLGNINNIWSTQQNLGQGADTALASALGTNGQPADYSGFENMPGYQFAVNQGTQAIQRQAASMGSAYTPNTAAAVGQYVTGTAAQDYNTYISQLMSAAGLGTTANQGLQTGNQTVGNNISQLQQNQGQAQASGVLGASNSVGGLFSSNGAGTGLIGAAGNYLFGNGSNGGATSTLGGSLNGLTGVGTNLLNGSNGGTTLTSGDNAGWNSALTAQTNNLNANATNGIDSSNIANGAPLIDTSAGTGSVLDSLNNSNFAIADTSGAPNYFNFSFAGTG